MTIKNTAPQGIPMPRIGAVLADGIFAGICRGEEGDHALVLLAEAPKTMTWPDAVKWAEALGEGVTLPTRAEQAVLFGNVKDQFPTGGWYWSAEQCAGEPAYAWCQYFRYGGQTNTRKDFRLRARAVRRLPLE